MVTKPAAKGASGATGTTAKLAAVKKVASLRAPATAPRKPKVAAAEPDANAAASATAEPAAPTAAAAETVRLSAQQVWQAGLAAFAKAQEEGGRVFSKLVEEGHALQQRRQASEAATSTPAAADGGDATAEPAAGAWDKLEQVFEQRVARALAKLGVPAQQEIDALTRRVDELAAQLAAANAAPAAAVVRKRAAVRKPAAGGAG